MWKDADGNIVTKRPTLSDNGHQQPHPNLRQDSLQSQSGTDFLPFQDPGDRVPISPPISHDTSIDRDSGIASSYHSVLDANPLSVAETYSPPIGQRFWSSNLSQPQPFAPGILEDAPFDDIFNPDTASSFNNPFTTMNNYNWLFDLNLSRQHVEPANLVADPFRPYQYTSNLSQSTMPGSFDLQLYHIEVEKTLSTAAQHGSVPSQRTDSQQNSPVPLISPPITDGELQNSNEPLDTSHPIGNEHDLSGTSPKSPLANNPKQANFALLDVERPLSMLQPSKCLPVIDELARAQILDLIDVTQPAAADGGYVNRDHPLLSLRCLQTYCDLFFTRFNTAYPLIHMSTFEPSHVDTLLLISVLLLGATYGEKDAHQLAVCIHDVIRPQIFANAGFSAKPDLWVLQTILLVECFGKSRAGQKQHDMSHLFHGLLINLIRRSDCQSIRPSTLEDSTEDLEDDWRTWVDAEQKKRLAFLCFMWDTQHAVLFCQSLCMSAFELRSTLPCDQALWEADSAEAWHQLRQKHPTPPLFLSCLKMYLNPSATALSKNLNALSRALLLHGLMSIAWDMQRRDRTSLGVIDTNPLGNWQTRLGASYKAWKCDFDAFCNQYPTKLPSINHFLVKEFQTFRTATLALYHSAHILLHTPFLDLQIYAGARHILGRPVARADYVRSQRGVKKWVAENMREAGKAVWHAAALVDQGVNILDGEAGSSDLGGGRLWHLPWCIYLGTLVVWGAWYAQPSPTSQPSDSSREDDDEIIWDPQAEMRSLLSHIQNVDPKRLVEGSGSIGGTGGSFGRGSLGKRGMNGLTAVVSKCLSKVRWAVVHDGMMVLRGLVCWRLVGGGGGLP
ncbi:hypothetical protein K469DRAFT_725730 [Zopfia rhizophila CBS 207.26]|uniref:Xylanolytic transcriptional activator regulatory domain-containing protein n=1 Tax=Zopfia rhizophila CBS 207.26 TaxID=1314779 RepID=A0A6A6E830_9PEZI|nr:hypothetical protein K469DRAFT_725730 [Zopfia rhizophila CBS 207.26]